MRRFFLQRLWNRMTGWRIFTGCCWGTSISLRRVSLGSAVAVYLLAAELADEDGDDVRRGAEAAGDGLEIGRICAMRR